MASLYEITNEYLELQSRIENGEDFDDLLQDINEDFESKAENYAKVMQNMKGDVEKIETEIARLLEKKMYINNGVERLKRALFNSMKATGKEKFKTSLFSFTIAKNGGKQKMQLDEDVPQEYQKAIYQPDKDKIREELENGVWLPFARLLEREESLRIR